MIEEWVPFGQKHEIEYRPQDNAVGVDVINYEHSADYDGNGRDLHDCEWPIEMIEVLYKTVQSEDDWILGNVWG